MLNKMILYVALFLLGTTILFFGISKYNAYKLEVSQSEVKGLKTGAVIIKKEYEVKSIEDNQTITFKKEKEIKDEEVPSGIGEHTIDID